MNCKDGGQQDLKQRETGEPHGIALDTSENTVTVCSHCLQRRAQHVASQV
jgi:hypothetical protein